MFFRSDVSLSHTAFNFPTISSFCFSSFAISYSAFKRLSFLCFASERYCKTSSIVAPYFRLSFLITCSRSIMLSSCLSSKYEASRSSSSVSRISSISSLALSSLFASSPNFSSYFSISTSSFELCLRLPSTEKAEPISIVEITELIADTIFSKEAFFAIFFASSSSSPTVKFADSISFIEYSKRSISLSRVAWSPPRELIFSSISWLSRSNCPIWFLSSLVFSSSYESRIDKWFLSLRRVMFSCCPKMLIRHAPNSLR